MNMIYKNRNIFVIIFVFCSEYKDYIYIKIIFVVLVARFVGLWSRDRSVRNLNVYGHVNKFPIVLVVKQRRHVKKQMG